MFVVIGLTLIGGSGRSAERGEIKPEFRPDLPPLGLFNFFSDFYMGVPLSPEGKKMLFCRAHISSYRDSG